MSPIFSLKNMVTIAAVVTMAAASPVTPLSDMGEISTRTACNGIDWCFKNNCQPEFKNPFDTIGECTQGEFNGCACEKCGSDIGLCDQNGCKGRQGICTAGNFQGCSCR